MKIRIELDENLIEDEVLIRCRSLDENVRKIQEAVSQVLTGKQQLICYKEDTEYYLSLDEILFLRQRPKRYGCIQQIRCIRPDINCMSWKNCCRDIL